jgi:hypothetical protein
LTRANQSPLTPKGTRVAKFLTDFYKKWIWEQGTGVKAMSEVNDQQSGKALAIRLIFCKLLPQAQTTNWLLKNSRHGQQFLF